MRILCRKTACFWPKTAWNPLKIDKRRETVATHHVRLDCPMTKSLLLPSNSTICPRNGPRREKNGLNAHCLCQTAPKSRTGRILGYVAQNRVPRAPSAPTCNPPLLVVSKLQISPRATPRPPYQWSLGGAGGERGPRTLGANGGSTGVPGAKKIIFSKEDPRRFGMFKQVFLARFEPVVTGFGPWKIPNCFENGPFWDQTWEKK